MRLCLYERYEGGKVNPCGEATKEKADLWPHGRRPLLRAQSWLSLHEGVDLSHPKLFPSFLSRTFNGEQMIDVLNGLDGGCDERMFAVFGNHPHQSHRELGIAYKSAWFLRHRVRFAMESRR